MKFPKSKYIENISTIRGHSQPIYGLVYEDGFLYTSSADRHVVRWNVETGEQTNFVIKLESSAYNLAFSARTHLLVIGDSVGNLHVVDVERRKELRLLTQHRTSIFALKYDEKTQRFYSGDRDGVFCIWSADNFDLLYVQHFHCGKIRDVVVHPEEPVLAISCRDGKLRFLSTETFEALGELKVSDHSLNSALFDGDFIYVGGKTGFISKWNWKTCKRVLNKKEHAFAIYDMALISNNKFLISASFDKTIKLWSAANLQLLESVDFRNEGHRSCVNRIAIISENRFATVSDDRKIKIWKLNEGIS